MLSVVMVGRSVGALWEPLVGMVGVGTTIFVCLCGFDADLFLGLLLVGSEAAM
jgi:hypothetical protein